MKQSKFFLGMAVASAMFSACSNDESYDSIAPVTKGEQIISLAVDNGGDAFRGSRAVERPLFSSEAKQNIDKVSLWICDEGGNVVYDHTLDNWNADGSVAYNEEGQGHGRKAKLVITGEDRLAQGSYTIYAIGYSSEGKTYTSVAVPVKNGTFNANDFVATSTSGKGAEIFATSATLTVPKNKDFKTNIVLHRQVAGIYAYLKGIPYEEGMTENASLIIEASQKLNTQLTFGAFAPNNDLANNGKDNVRTNVVNAGTPVGSDNIVATINLKDWFGNTLEDKVNNKTTAQEADGLIDATNWDNHYKGQADFVEGSVFVGQFIQPFKKNDDVNTFVMYLTKDGKEKTQYKWNINLAEDNILTSTTIKVWNGTQFDDVESYSETARRYSVFRNHLYAIGHKGHDKNPTPGPGPEPTPDPDPDKPVDISNTQELILKVNDNWEVIHDMVVE